MKSLNLKKIATGTALGLVTLLGAAELTTAQGQDRRRDDRRDDQKQERKIDKQQEKIERERARMEQDRIQAEPRQAEYARQQNSRYRIEQQRQAELIRQQNERNRIEQQRQADRNRQYNQSGNDRSNGNGYYNGNANANTNRNNRYRVNRNGTYYNTDQRGADLLRQAVNAGYQQGFQAARNDLNRNRRGTYSNSNVYQSGTYGYQSYVSQSQYQYYFRQGFQRGYQDGANTRFRDQYNNGQYNNYDQQYQYGSSSNGVLSILGSILGQILNIQTY